MEGLPEFFKHAILQQVAQANVLVPVNEKLPIVKLRGGHSSEETRLFDDARREEFETHGVTLLSDFVGDADSLHRVHEELMALRPSMKQAGMSSSGHVDSTLRGDEHMWLDTSKEHSQGLATLFKRFAEAQTELSQLSGVSFGVPQTQATCYPPGAQYVRHLDASIDKAPSRLITLVWYPAACVGGGQLRIFLQNGEIRDIEPQADVCVVFQSRLLEHSVLPCQSDRFAVSQWITEGIV